MALVAVLLGLALAGAAAVVARAGDTTVPVFEDRVVALLLGGSGVLVVLVALLAHWADRSGDDDPLLQDRLLGR